VGFDSSVFDDVELSTPRTAAEPWGTSLHPTEPDPEDYDTFEGKSSPVTSSDVFQYNPKLYTLSYLAV
jgi:hypothetical protein